MWLDFGTKVVSKGHRSATELNGSDLPAPLRSPRLGPFVNAHLPLHTLSFRTYRFWGLVWEVRLAPISGAIFFSAARVVQARKCGERGGSHPSEKGFR
jgi:hypothetical protein